MPHPAGFSAGASQAPLKPCDSKAEREQTLLLALQKNKSRSGVPDFFACFRRAVSEQIMLPCVVSHASPKRSQSLLLSQTKS
jgi:hypothetical protein